MTDCARCDWSVRVHCSSIKHAAYVTRNDFSYIRFQGCHYKIEMNHLTNQSRESQGTWNSEYKGTNTFFKRNNTVSWQDLNLCLSTFLALFRNRSLVTGLIQGTFHITAGHGGCRTFSVDVTLSFQLVLFYFRVRYVRLTWFVFRFNRCYNFFFF